MCIRDSLQAVAGDAFHAVPPDCDTYLFVNVLHDWSDDDACRLLRVARTALGSAGRVVVVEQERRAVPIDDIGTRTDLLMLALTPGGRERTTAAFARLAGAADLRLDTSVTLASGDRAHVLRP